MPADELKNLLLSGAAQFAPGEAVA